MRSKKTIFSTLVILSIMLSLLAIPTTIALAGGGCTSGTNGDDTIVCDSDVTGNINAKDGDDSVTIDAGVTIDGNVSGGTGTDTITNNGSADLLAGGDDNDTITNNGTTDRINGNDGDDTIVNNDTVTDTIAGGLGNDEITNNGTTSILSGNDGNDTITNKNTVTDLIAGGLGDDEIINDGTANSINGNDGNDTITNNSVVTSSLLGGPGNDEINNNGTTDTINSGDDDDTITNSGTVTNDVKGNLGNDTVILEDGTQVGGTIFGANGKAGAGTENDTLIFKMSTYDQAEYDAAKTVIAGATDELDTYQFNWDGGVVSWQYFDTLIDKLVLLFKPVSKEESPASDPKPESTETTTLIFVEQDVLKAYQNNTSGTLRFFGIKENSHVFIAELAPQSWKNAVAGNVLLDVENTSLGTRLVVTALENGQLQVEYFSLGDGSLLLTKILVP